MRKLLALSFLPLSFLFSVIAHSQPVSIESRGIGGGGALFSPAIDPHNPSRIFMACDMTEMFFTESGGSSWDLYDFREFTAFNNSEMQFTSDPDILYSIHFNFRPDEYIPVKSTDGGDSWSPVNDPTGNFAWQLLADPGSTDRLLVSNGNTLFFSNDAAATWTAIASPGNDEMYVAGAFWQGDSIFIGTRNGMIYSTNGGTSFQTFANAGLPAGSGFSSFSGAFSGGVLRLYGVVHQQSALYYYAQAYDFSEYEAVVTLSYGVDATWQDISPAGNHYFYHCAAHPSTPGTLYLGGTSGTNSYLLLYKTTDAGTSWTNTFTGTDNTNITPGWCGEGSENNWWYAEIPMGLAVDHSDADHVVFTDYGFIHSTTNGGATWQQNYVSASTQNAAGSDILPGKAYTGLFENTTSWHVLQPSDSILLASFGDIAGIGSDDKGSSWSYRRINTDYNSNCMMLKHPVSPRIYAATSSVHDLYQSTYISDTRIGNGTGEILYSDNNGLTWNTLHNFADPVIWMAIDPSDNEIMYASIVRAGAGGIYKTTNLSAGASSVWTKVTEPPRTEDHPFIVEVLNDGHVVCTYSANRTSAFTQSSGVFYSSDGGATWSDRSSPGMLYWTKDVLIDPGDPLQHIWYAAVFTHYGAGSANQGGIYRTTDRGVTWSKLEDIYRCESISIDPVNPEKAYVTSEDQGLLVTSNLSDPDPDFTEVTEYKFQHPVRVFFDAYDPDRAWITSFGNGLSLMQTGQGAGINPTPGAHLSVYPNPADESVTLRSDGVISSFRIVSLSGQTVQSGNVNEEIAEINLGNIAPGFYILSVKTGGQLINNPLVVR